MSEELEEIEAVLRGLREQLHEAEAAIPEDAPLKFAAGLSLLLSAFDMAISMTTLLLADPAVTWVSAHVLQRPQFEHYIRGMFFLGPASEEEAEAFLTKSELPARISLVGEGSRQREVSKQITHAQMVTEVVDHYGLPENLITINAATWKSHNDLVHGGRVITGIYFHDNQFGPADVTADNIVGMLCNPLATALGAFAMLPEIGFKSLQTDKVRELMDRGHKALEVAGRCLDASCDVEPHTPVAADDARQ